MVFALEAKFKKQEKAVKQWLSRLTAWTNHRREVVEVFLVGDKFLAKSGRALLTAYQKTKKSAGRPESFNVLAFSAPADFLGAGKKKNLGEIYLNFDHIKKNKEDLRAMLIHGFLHLIGYDHKRSNDRIEMEKEEARLMALFQNVAL